MGLKEIFLGSDSRFESGNIGGMLKEGLPGLLLVLATGFLAYFLANTKKFGLPAIPYMHYLDMLVLAIILGMIIRLIIQNTGIMGRIAPGLMLAPAVFIPIGIILYGKGLSFTKLGQVGAMSLVWMLVIMAATFALIYWLSNKFGLSNKMAYLLGAGSAVCGASAIAITSPAVEAEPDELGAALVTNTILVIISLLILKALTGLFSPDQWAAMAGTLLQQTGFVKIATAGGSVANYALLIKSARVGLLIILIPLIYWLNTKTLRIPWYLVGFIGLGLWASYGTISSGLSSSISVAYGILFSSALAGIGMNAHLGQVVKKLGKPLLVTLIALVAGIVLFWIGTTFITYAAV